MTKYSGDTTLQKPDFKKLIRFCTFYKKIGHWVYRVKDNPNWLYIINGFGPLIVKRITNLIVYQELGALEVSGSHPDVVFLSWMVKLCQTPIDQPQLPVLVIDHDVVRLHVAMHNAHAATKNKQKHVIPM